jgi:hypothetical protein
MQKQQCKRFRSLRIGIRSQLIQFSPELVAAGTMEVFRFATRGRGPSVILCSQTPHHIS